MLEVVVIVLTLVGLAGTVLPGIPGTLLIFGVGLGYSWLTGFERIEGWVLWTLAGMALIAQVSDMLLGALTAKLAGASGRAVLGAAVGALVGIFVLGPLGLILGPVIGAFVVELVGGKDLFRSSRSGIAAGAGTLIGMALNVVLGLGMAILLWVSMWRS